jgi:hypothetical protein
MTDSLVCFSILKMKVIFPPKRRYNFYRLYGVISQKTVLPIVTAMRTSIPT